MSFIFIFEYHIAQFIDAWNIFVKRVITDFDTEKKINITITITVTDASPATASSVILFSNTC